MKNREIAKKCGDSAILSGHRNIGSSEFRRNLDGCFWGVARAQEIFEGNL